MDQSLKGNVIGENSRVSTFDAVQRQNCKVYEKSACDKQLLKTYVSNYYNISRYCHDNKLSR